MEGGYEGLWVGGVVRGGENCCMRAFLYLDSGLLHGLVVSRERRLEDGFDIGLQNKKISGTCLALIRLLSGNRSKVKLARNIQVRHPQIRLSLPGSHLHLSRLCNREVWCCTCAVYQYTQSYQPYEPASPFIANNTTKVAFPP